jgi:hypothetical protein
MIPTPWYIRVISLAKYQQFFVAVVRLNVLVSWAKKYDAGKREGRGRIKLTVQLGQRDNALKFDHI